eukprot:TRINITY_DN7100_c0_g3_i1.p1 TRINITY_DN7100_c0_g3~~TRINITY_DN7100_c0_g3_i1.p1  ORF type:complete len:389 (-),score=96.06 TRINITY_DN7100_c0_g3_i1:873-2039(-)
MSSSQPAVVVDLGTAWTKAGWSDDEAPRAVFPSSVGRPRHKGVMVGVGGPPVKVDFGNGFSKIGTMMPDGSVYLGEEALTKRGIVVQKNVMEKSTVVSWDDCEKLLHHCFYEELKIDPEEHPALFSWKEHEGKSFRADKEKLIQILLETFNFPSVCIAPNASMALNVSGFTSGIVLDMGEGINTATAVFEGKAISCSVKQVSENSGKVLSSLVLDEHKEELVMKDKELTARDIKEKKLYVCSNFEEESASLRSKTSTTVAQYELPDGSVLSLGKEIIEIPERLFYGAHSLSKLVHSSGNAVSSTHAASLSNVVVIGGGSSLTGFFPRFSTELLSHVDNSNKFSASTKLLHGPQCKYTSWIGASIFSSTTAFSPISRDVFIMSTDQVML